MIDWLILIGVIVTSIAGLGYASTFDPTYRDKR